MCSQRTIWSLYGLCVASNVLDFLLTRLLVLDNGPWAELNPLERHEILSHGISSILWTKALALSFLALITWFALDRSRPFLHTALLGVNAVMVFNLIWTGAVFWSYTLTA